MIAESIALCLRIIIFYYPNARILIFGQSDMFNNKTPIYGFHEPALRDSVALESLLADKSALAVAGALKIHN
jgi:hypothetical protein